MLLIYHILLIRHDWAQGQANIQFFQLKLQLYLNRMMEKVRNELPQDQLQLMTRNLQLLQRQITEQDESIGQGFASSPLGSSDNMIQQIQNVVGSGKLRTIYEGYLLGGTLPTNHQQKIVHLLQEKICVGSAMAMFEMVFYFKQALEQTLVQEIQRKAFQKVSCGHNSNEELACYSQLIAQCGQQDEEICQYYAQAILQRTIHFDTAMLVLTNQSTTGLIYLIDIASRDIQLLTHKILDYLCRTQSILLTVIIPALIQSVIDLNLSRNRDLCLAALNRLAPLLIPDQVRQLILLINDASIDKKLLISTIRCAGLRGQQMLLNLVNSKQFNQNIVSIALSVLSWRIPAKSVLRVKSIQYTLQHSFLPGRFYQYEGSLQPWDYGQDHCPDTLCLSSRDFLAHLHSFISEHPLPSRTSMNNKSLSQIVQALQLDDDLPLQISHEVIQTLILQLKNKSSSIREIALLELGNIGQPSATIASEPVSKCLNDNDSAIRSAACWTIARICPMPSKKIQKKLTELLKDHFWKVRTSACIALGLILKQPQMITVQTLIKCLQDGSIPKPTVCETLARMGAEQLLLQIIRGSARNDFKLRQAVISSFAFTPTQSPILASIIEQIFRYSRDSRIETRELCLLTLSSLRKQVQLTGTESLAYFHSKHLLPFYYCFLDDPSSKIRAIAAENLLTFGPQAELIFIQGMTKGQPLAKIQCIKCLGRLGPQNFRAVALGLRDEDARVRTVACQTLVGCYRSEQVIQEFSQRQSQSTSLICNLKQMLASPNLNQQLLEMLQSILEGLQGREKGNRFVHSDENVRWN